MTVGKAIGFSFFTSSLVILLLYVTGLNGFVHKAMEMDAIRVDDVINDDTDLNKNVGKHLENSVKKVYNKMSSNAMKLICRMLPCSDWSAWSVCGSVVGRRGTRSRTRECGYNVLELCKENDSGYDQETHNCMIYIPWCPLNYVYTRNGFCIKLYNDVFKSWYDAQIHCESDGGHLVNIDTQMLSNDIDESFDDTDLLSVYAWIDGIKRLPGTQWEFKSGLKKPKFTNWYGGHPKEENYPNCKCVIRSGDEVNFEWRSSFVCGNRENFICQIKKEN